MPKPKVNSIQVGAMYGDWQEIFINGNQHAFNIYWTPATVLEELEKHYDFDYLDRKDITLIRPFIYLPEKMVTGFINRENISIQDCAYLL